MTTTTTNEEANEFIASGEVAAGIERAFEEAARMGQEGPKGAAHPDAGRLMDEAFDRAEAALGSNVLPFRKPGGRA